MEVFSSSKQGSGQCVAADLLANTKSTQVATSNYIQYYSVGSVELYLSPSPNNIIMVIQDRDTLIKLSV